MIHKTQTRGRIHGYGITMHIQKVSDDVLRVEEGSIYPALHRMEQDGWIKAEWGTSENNRRARFYEITARGLKQLGEQQRNWEQLTRAVANVLNMA